MKSIYNRFRWNNYWKNWKVSVWERKIRIHFLVLAPHSNFGSDLSIDNVVGLDSTDTRIASQDAVNKVLEFIEKWKYPNFRGKF